MYSKKHVINLTFLFVMLSIQVLPISLVTAQSIEMIDTYALIDVQFQNRNRFSLGEHDQECPPCWPHDCPWGNWGVNSNFSGAINAHQFMGWKPIDSQWHWNSCTSGTWGISKLQLL
jgi:hypothetical protein